jgi:CheY-like chemotaxis protein/anti-sigma regulatory factor (Ser/Thr protein kinase)
MQDVTELRRNEQTIAEQQQALVHSEALAAIGSLAASVAHEINNPLAYVLLNLEAVLANPTDAAQPRLQEALDGVRRVGSIVKTLKALSGLHAPEPGAVDVRQPIGAAVSMAWNGIAPRAKLVKDLVALPPVLGDEVRLAQVFLNLLVNASAAIEEGHPERNEIRISATAGQGEVVVEVHDTGSGIAPEHLGRIFEPFFSTKSRAKGTGLGLPISRKIVEETGGRIEVKSELGRGTSFFVHLTLAPTAQPAPKLAAPAPATTEAPRLRVLVADDERLIRRAIARALHKCVIVEAESGDQARALLEGDRDFDVVLCDMMMPGLSGMDLHEWLSQVDPALTARMVFITGGAFTPPARAFLERPDVRRLDKPFEGAALRELVQQVAQLRHPAS